MPLALRQVLQPTGSKKWEQAWAVQPAVQALAMLPGSMLLQAFVAQEAQRLQRRLTRPRSTA